MPRRTRLRVTPLPHKSADTTDVPAGVRQPSVIKEEVSSQQQDWSSGLDQEDPEPPHIKEEHEEPQVLEGGDITKLSRLQDLKQTFRRRLLTATRHSLIGHFDTTISAYEKEIDRQQNLLDVLLKPHVKLHRADVPAGVRQPSVIKEEVSSQLQDWSSGLDQEDPELPHIKEEHEEPQVLEGGDIIKLSRLQDLKQTFRRRLLTATRHSLIGHFDTTISAYEKEIDRQQNLLDVLLKPHVKLHRAELPAEEEEVPAEQQDRSSGNSDPDSPPDNEDNRDSCEPERDEDWKGTTCCCPFCDKTFKHKGNVKSHMRTHSGVKPFSCSLCGKSFTQKAALMYHTKGHKEVKAFRCSHCGKTFRGMSQLKVHKSVHRSLQFHKSDKGKKPLSCSECSATFPNKYLLMTHIRSHKGKKLFTCTVCGAKRHFSSHLEIHMRTHTGEKPYSCSVCGKRFSQTGIMKQHMAIHSGVKPFACSDCGKRFCWQFQIKKHKCPGKSSQEGGSAPARIFNPFRHFKAKTNAGTRTSLENDDIGFWKDTRQHQSGFTYQRNKKCSVSDGPNSGRKPLKCSDDTANAGTATDTGVNMEGFTETGRQHTGPNPQKQESVSLSDSGFNEKPFQSSARQIRCEDMLQTQKKHHTDRTPLSCLFCAKEFATGGYLTRHISVHTGLKLLTCIVCEKTFSLKSELLAHQCYDKPFQPHQMANKPFGCSQCGKGFALKQQLQLHMRTHAGETPLSCSVCGKTFARRESLSSHMSCHSGDKTFRCSVCDTHFVDSESLIKHMRIHTTQTRFSCSICDKEFAWRRCLTKHMNVHLREKLYRCNMCERVFTQLYQLHYHRCVDELPRVPDETLQTEADGEDCGGPEPARDSSPNYQPGDGYVDSSGSQTGDNGDWKESRGLQSSVNSQSEPDGKQLNFSDETIQTIEKLLYNSEPENPITQAECLSQHRDVKQENPEPPRIKEEQEELWIGREADTTKSTFNPVPVKSEDDDEEKPLASQLHQTEQMEPEADGEDRGGPEPTRNSCPDSEDSVDSDFWKDTRERTIDRNCLKNDEISESLYSGSKVLSCSDDKISESLEPDSDNSDDSDFWNDNRKIHGYSNRPYSCSECEKRFFHIHHLKDHMKLHERPKEFFFCSICGHQCLYKSHLKIHMRMHTGEKPFVCPVCGKKYAHKASVQSHMSVHTTEKQHSCNVCGKGFAWFTELKYHQCVVKS